MQQHSSKAGALAVLLILMAGAISSAQGQTCPIQPEQQDLDFAPVVSACADAKTLCSGCTCALVDVFRPALVAGGVTFDPNAPASFPLDKAAGIIRACSEQYIVSMLMANINVTALSALSSCSYTADSVPSCLAPAVKAIAAGNVTTVKATSRDPDTAVPGGTTDLRVATVQKSGTTVLITLAGQLSSATQLLKTLAASQDLLTALGPDEASKLQALAAAPGTIDQNPATAGTLAALSNPMDAMMLINNLSKLAASSPAAPVAAPAPAPLHRHKPRQARAVPPPPLP